MKGDSELAPRAPRSAPAPESSAESGAVRLDGELSSALRDFVAAQRAPGTRSKYEEYLRDFFGACDLRSLDEVRVVEPAQVVDYRNRLQDRGLSSSTINGRLVAVRGFFGRLLKTRQISGNPADSDFVPGLQVSDVSRTEGLTLEEVKAILSTCDGTLQGLRDRALLMTLFYQGLRRSEASKLRYRDISTRLGLLEIKDAKNNPYSTIRLRPEVKQAIDDYLEVLNRDLAKRETKPDDPVFCSLSRLRSFGRRLAPSSINNIVKTRARLGGIPRRITAHSWRHTCTTAALQAGVSLHQVQRHLRHKSIQTTLRYDRDREVRKNPTLDLLPPVE
jgi:site-specific recombinase XerD